MGDGHEFDPVREVFGQLHQHNLMLSRALVAEKSNASLRAESAQLRAALLVCERVLSFDLAEMVTWGPNYRQQVKDALDAVRAALLSARGEA